MSASSSTSSATSRISSTSEAARLAGLLRLLHPFPSILDGLVAAALALVAGSGPGLAATLGLGMTALQFGIGATNDLVDAPRDAVAKPLKPIPAGIVAARAARVVAVAAFGAGLGLSALAGPAVLAVATLVAGVGLAYDFVLKGTPWSWLGFALGLPLLPVYAWVGATGSLPAPFAVLVPAGALAGAALALANGLVDVERDAASGATSAAGRLGAEQAWRVGAILQVVLVAVAGVSAVALGGGGGGLIVGAIGVAAIAAGLAGGRRRDEMARERGWELQAVGVGLLAVGWLASLVSTGAL